MENRDKIITFLKNYLEVENFSDYCHNGLQIEGTDKIKTIITGVSLSEKLIRIALEKKAQMILVHHGVFQDAFANTQIKGFLKKRLQLLLANDINLAGFHLPLDAHPKIGNNISIAKVLKLKNIKSFAGYGFVGDLPKSQDFSEFVKTIDNKLTTKSNFLAHGKKTVKKVAIVSGVSSAKFELASLKGADVYICGDLKEHVFSASLEIGLNIINVGHYNSEKLGIQNLGELLAKKFKIKHQFIDIPCEI